MSTHVVLASRSPRRVQLLAQLGITPQIIPADIDETPRSGESAVPYVERLARDKAKAVAARCDVTGVLILAADTTIDIDNDILGQPVDIDEARMMLRRLSGRTHRVHTAVAVLDDSGIRSQVVTTLVTCVPITDDMLAWYLQTNEWQGKAGAYAIQGQGAVLVETIRGSYSNVVGLPLRESAQLLGLSGVASDISPQAFAEYLAASPPQNP